MRVDEFNTTFLEMMNNLRNIFPNNKELSELITSARLGMAVHPTYVIEMFTKEMTPYKDAVRQRDDMALAHLNSTLSSLYHQLAPNNQDIVWQYVEHLMTLIE
jgi:hypothetical protein